MVMRRKRSGPVPSVAGYAPATPPGDRAVTAIVFATALALAAPPTKPTAEELFEDCRYNKPEDKPPQKLRETYAAFVASIPGGGQAKFCLGSVEVSNERDPERGEYGTGINIPWMKEHFSAKVQVCRNDGDDTFLIRTGTSYLFWVQTKSGAWKLFKSGDKPIQ